ncbi:hypothetical protein ASG31_13315 [Chryseobacterium sp. Leaf404]|uniref:hypothetical protein n=1 Tax=unclassified Chryseobacterium TaxID=2593645 RepID=UPI0006F809BB|nr:MULTISPECIES: hypothetical protein [unclassified Chryseobacterium]KQT16485.1 hypothetical protein ASG31_13315 [Chryseobacterium sp. Leaf404]
MIVNIELENKEDFAFIKQLLEKIKGVKSVSIENEYEQNGELPENVLEATEKYGASLRDDDTISKEDFVRLLIMKYAG